MFVPSVSWQAIVFHEGGEDGKKVDVSVYSPSALGRPVVKSNSFR